MSNIIMSGLTTITTVTIFDGYDNFCAIIDDVKNLACRFHYSLPENRIVKTVCYGLCVVVLTRSLPYLFRRTAFFEYFDRELIFFHRSSGHNEVIDIKKKLLRELRETNDLPKNQDGELVILELYAGSGNNLSYYPKDAVVIATDTLDGMKEKFEENILLQNDERKYSFLNSPSETLDSLPDETVSCCVCFYSLCSSRGIGRTLQEIRRLLMPRGKVYFIEHIREYNRFSSMWFLQINFMPTLFLIGCCIRHVESWIESAGFQRVSYEKCHINMSKYNKPMQALTPHLFGFAVK